MRDTIIMQARAARVFGPICHTTQAADLRSAALACATRWKAVARAGSSTVRSRNRAQCEAVRPSGAGAGVDDDDTGFVMTTDEVSRQLAKIGNTAKVPTGACVTG